MLLACHVLAFVSRAISPGFDALTVLEVVSPVPLVGGSIDMEVDTIAVGLIVDPFTVVYISVYVDELALSVGSVVLPLSSILCTIWPLLNSVPISESSDPFSIISCSSFEGESGSLFTFSIRVVSLSFGDSFSALIDCKVPRISLL